MDIYYKTKIAIEKGIAKGILDSGKQLLSITANAIKHPINTSVAIYKVMDSIDTFQKKCIFDPIDSYKQIYNTITDSQTWVSLRDAVIPELRNLMEDWGNLNLDGKVERISYLISKTGSDIFLPGAATKVAFQGLKEVKTLVQIAKNLQNTEKLIVLEAFAGTGGGTGEFAQVAYRTGTAEKMLLPHASDLLNKIKTKPPIKTKADFFNIFQENEKIVGLEGTRQRIRLFSGGESEGRKVFNELTKNAKSINNTTYPGKMFVLEDGTIIGFRPLSKSGPPTIDIKLPDIKDNIKFKFLEE